VEALAQDGSPEAVRILAEAATSLDKNETAGAMAARALWNIHDQSAVDAVCAVWAATRHPGLVALLKQRGWVASEPTRVRVLTALKMDRLEGVTGAGPEVVGPLAEACQDVDEVIQRRAQRCLVNLTDLDTIDALCSRWAKKREALLTDVVTQAAYLARAPIEIRVLTALGVGKLRPVTHGGAAVIDALVDACNDADAVIAERAQSALGQLESQDAKEHLCRLVVERDLPTARRVAASAGYTPRDEFQRALFLFLTEQWSRYEVLDFDHRLLHTVYNAADDALKERLRTKMRLAGRADVLTVIVGGDRISRARDMTQEEAEFLVQMLAEKEEWARLWPLTFEFPLALSARVASMLARSGWLPDREDDRAVFRTLATLATRNLPDSIEEIDRHLPPAVRRAQARVPGRINAVAFSPNRPVIAVGTGWRKVATWNFQEAEREHVIDGFDHSIGRVVYTGKDTLVCAERTNSTSVPCALHAWRNGRVVRLGQHRGSVTGLVPIGASRVLSTGRDGTAVIWDAQARRRVARQGYEAWARGVCVSRDGRLAALLHNGFTLLALPRLNVLAHRWGSRGVLRCAAFSPSAKELLVGKYNGDVIVLKLQHRGRRLHLQMLTRHDGRAEGVELLPHRPVVVMAWSCGEVRFMAWPSRVSMGSVHAPGGGLTSLHVSPDGAFMAVGRSDATLSLWDLRVLNVPVLFARPFAQANPVDLATVSALASDTKLHRQAKPAVRFAECILQRRFRYDIEISEVPTIRVGEFDIEID
jgi:HEAT repeat protein